MTRTAILLLFSGSALAQQAVVDHCKQTSSDADRIACLEAALLGKEASAAMEELPAAMPVAEPETRPEVAAEVAEAVPEGIGAEQVIASSQTMDEREESREKVTGLAIASYDWVPYERLVVTFENGQVWRQIKGDVNRIRTSLERNQTADITESGLGGYQLHLNEIRRTIRVERIR